MDKKIILLFFIFFFVHIVYPETDNGEKSILSKDLESVHWKERKSIGGITTYYEESGTGLIAVRGVTRINADIKTILSVLINDNYESQRMWVPNLLEFKTVESNSIFDRILYVRVDIPWPVKDRDFTYKAKIEVLKDKKKVKLFYSSLDRDIDPVEHRENTVRALMKTCFILTYVNDTVTEVDLRAVADPCGMVPQWVVNFAQRNYSKNMLKKMAKIISEKRDIKIRKEFESLNF